jgi:hypothetical protein
MATSTTPQPYTADPPENSTTSVDASRPDAPQRWNTRYAGKPTGISIDSGGYASLQIDKRRYLTHRIVWLHTKGWLPKQDLDHRDGNRTNNAIENLRLATVSQNNANQVRTSRKGFPRGCQQDPKTGNWNVKIKAQGKVVYIGSFSEREVAARAYLDAAELLHGQFSVAERPRPEAVEIAT